MCLSLSSFTTTRFLCIFLSLSSSLIHVPKPKKTFIVERREYMQCNESVIKQRVHVHVRGG